MLDTLTEEDLFDEIAAIAEDLYENAIDLDKAITRIERESIIFSEAFLKAEEFIRKYAIDYIKLEAKKAAVKSREYDYPPFLNRLLTAIDLHKKDILFIIPHKEREEVEVILDMTPLGSIEEYAQAVIQTREVLGMGRAPGEVASKMWKEKFYKVDREGGKVSKRKKDKKTKKVTKVDVTEKFRGRYKTTILTRLNYLGGDKAPYWYLLEHGSNNVKMSSDKGGQPYPSFGATHFVSNSENAIANAFRYAFIDFKVAIEDSYADSLIKDYAEEVGKPVDTIEDVVEVVVEAAPIFIERMQIPKPPGKQTIAKTTVGEVSIAGYMTKKGAWARGRSLRTGRFVSLK